MIQELLSYLNMQGALQALSDVQELKDTNQVIRLLQAEIDYREAKAINRRLSQAKFLLKKEWCDIDKNLNPSIDFGKIETWSDGLFIDKRENVCLMGQQGTGKTHSLVALGREACRKGKSVKFYSACSLVNELEEAKANNKLSKLMKQLTKVDFLIIDELGFVPFSENGARLLFDVFSSRHEKGSIGLSTNLSFEKWVQIFGTAELTAALIDRFTHRCLIYNFQGKSVRFMEAEKRKEGDKAFKK